MADRRMISKDIFKSSVACKLSEVAPDKELHAQRIFQTLIFLADDYGRGKLLHPIIKAEAFAAAPNSAMAVTIEEVAQWIETIRDEGAIELYEVNGDKYYRLKGWEYYQRGNWRPTKSNIPPSPTEVLDNSPESNEEVPDNSPITKPLLPDNENPPLSPPQTPPLTPPEGESKGNKSKRNKTAPTGANKVRGHIAVQMWVDLYREVFKKDFIITPILAKHIVNAFKVLKKDLAEFERCVRNCFKDEWYREHQPGPLYFYNNINKWKNPPVKREATTY